VEQGAAVAEGLTGRRGQPEGRPEGVAREPAAGDRSVATPRLWREWSGVEECSRHGCCFEMATKKRGWWRGDTNRRPEIKRIVSLGTETGMKRCDGKNSILEFEGY